MSKIFKEKNQDNHGLGISKSDFMGLIQMKSELKVELPRQEYEPFNQFEEQKNAEHFEQDYQPEEDRDVEQSRLQEQWNPKKEDDLELDMKQSTILQDLEEEIMLQNMPDHLEIKKKQSSYELMQKLDEGMLESINNPDTQKINGYDDFIFCYYQVRQSDDHFLDPAFLPNHSHLGANPKFQGIQWRPAAQIFQNE